MGQGQGSISVTQKREQAAGPPFGITAADNGLSVDPITRRIVLGQSLGEPGDPARFLDNRQIPMDNFLLQLFSGPSNQLQINPLISFYQFGNENAGNGNQLRIDDLNQRWEIGQSSLVQNLLLSFPGAGIGLSFFDVNGTNPFLIPAPGTGGSTFLSGPDFLAQLQLEEVTGRASLGDIGGFNGGVKSVVDPIGKQFIVEDGAFNQYLFLNCDPLTGSVFLGKLDPFTSGARLFISSATGFQRFTLESDGPNQVPLDFDPVTAIYMLGDTFNQINNCKFTIDVNAQRFKFDNGILQIGGTDGFTGSVLAPTQIDVSGGIVTNVI